MRKRIYRNRTIAIKELQSLFPFGEITRNNRFNHRGLFCYLDREFGNFKTAYKFAYNKEYIDKRTITDKSGKNNGRYSLILITE